jgi:hypothetical protein
MRLGTSLSSGAGVEKELPFFPEFIDRNMAVTENDHVGTGEATVKASGSAFGCTTIVDECDLDTIEIDDSAFWQDASQLTIVVPEYCKGLDHALETSERCP